MGYSIHCKNLTTGGPDQIFSISDPADGVDLANQPASICAFSTLVSDIPELKHETYHRIDTGDRATGYRWFSDNPAMIAHLGYTKPHSAPEYSDPAAVEVVSAYDYGRLARGDVSVEELREEGSVYVLHPNPLMPTYENLAAYLAYLNAQMYPYNQMSLVAG